MADDSRSTMSSAEIVQPFLLSTQRNFPSKKLVERSVDKSEPWRLWMHDAEDWPAIFEVIVAVANGSEGRTPWLTAAEGEWVAQIGRLERAGGRRVPAFEKYLLARLLAKAEATSDHDTSPDLFFAARTGLLVGKYPVEGGWLVGSGEDLV